MDHIIRPATADDLLPITRVWLAAEDESSETIDVVPPVLAHLLRTGTLLVAEGDGGISGFGSAFTRSSVTYLGQLFIHPGRQSGGVGRALLQTLMPDDGLSRVTVASSDARAISLYVRHGMIPLWPMFDVHASATSLRGLVSHSVDVVQADADDPEIVRADAAIGGRVRPEDHDFWVQHRAGLPLWFERAGKRIGYGYLQVLSRSATADPGTANIRIGPLGAYDPSDSLGCLLAAVRLSREHGSTLRILVPGPHPALRWLFDMGFHIGDQETFFTSIEPPIMDSRRYIPSGGGLF